MDGSLGSVRRRPHRGEVIATKLSFLPVLLLGSPFLGAGCATLVNGRTQTIAVVSEPSGARVFVGADLVGVTPARFILDRKRSDIVVRVEKEGYVPQSVALNQEVSRWILGDVAYGALQLPLANKRTALTSAAFVLGIDLLTGAGNRLSPSKVQMKLETLVPDGGTTSPVKGTETGLTDEDRAAARKIAQEWVAPKSRPKP